MGSNVYANTLVRIRYDQAAPVTTWNIAHGIGTTAPVVDCYTLQGGEYTRVWPQHVYVVDANNVQLVFTVATAGYATVM